MKNPSRSAGRGRQGKEPFFKPAADADIEQAHGGGTMLRIDNRPLPEPERLVVKDDGQQPLPLIIGLHHRDLNFMWEALDVGNGHAAREAHLIVEQNGERGARERNAAQLLQFRVAEDDLAMVGNQEQRRWLIVFEAHAPRAEQPNGAAGDGAVGGHLFESRRQRANAVQISGDAVEIGFIGTARRCRKRAPRQQKHHSGKQGTTSHQRGLVSNSGKIMNMPRDYSAAAGTAWASAASAQRAGSSSSRRSGKAKAQAKVISANPPRTNIVVATLPVRSCK